MATSPEERYPTKTDLRIEANIPHDRATRSIQRLLDAGLIEEVPMRIKTGKNGQVTREVTGYRRRPATEKSEKSNTDLPFQAHSE